MIKNLDAALQLGKPWPPASEVQRLQTYEENENLFLGEHTKVFRVLLNLFSSHTAEYNKIIIILNWHKRLSTLWADFLFGEQPRVTVSDDPESVEQKYADDFIERNRFWLLQHSRQIDVSRFGHGIIEGYYDDGCKLQVVHPSKYFPIGDSFGRVQAHMIAWSEEPEVVDHIKQRRLFCRIHWPGRIEGREYLLSSSGYIIAGPENIQITDTGIDEPLVSVVENLATSSGGLVDDYHDLDSLLKRMESRLTRVGRILDVHSEPLLVLPEDSGAFTKTDTGAVIYDSKKKVLERVKGAADPGYVTWEGQLTAAFLEFETDLKQLYALSETCEACFEPAKAGAQASGTALRLMLFVPLKKVDRLKLTADPTIRAELKTFTDFEKARGFSGSVPLQSVSIMWQDGLPEDFNETVLNVCSLKDRGLITDEMAFKMLYKLEGKALTDAVAKLKSEAQAQQQAAPAAPTIELPPMNNEE
ncbi:phage portal protein [Candidatus Pacearchaeota archaeon]|jgi:hypothetical protein|nr:phage portal protein [Candidatus Pacearchaeota archaeon]